MNDYNRLELMTSRTVLEGGTNPFEIKAQIEQTSYMNILCNYIYKTTIELHSLISKNAIL